MPEKNGIGQSGLKRQKVTKKPVTEAALAAEGLEEVGKLEETGGPEEA